MRAACRGLSLVVDYTIGDRIGFPLLRTALPLACRPLSWEIGLGAMRAVGVQVHNNGGCRAGLGVSSRARCYAEKEFYRPRCHSLVAPSTTNLHIGVAAYHCYYPCRRVVA